MTLGSLVDHFETDTAVEVFFDGFFGDVLLLEDEAGGYLDGLLAGIVFYDVGL